MGRWAQRRRTGGGPSILNYITDAVQQTATTIILTYAYPIDATELIPVDFESSPSGAIGDTITQLTNDTIQLDLDASSAGDDEIQYSGSTPGVRTPQQVQYS